MVTLTTTTDGGIDYEWSELPWPEFNGDYLSYRLFKREFNTLADSVYMLSDYYKLYYLEKCVKDEALRDYQRFSPNPATCTDMWDYMDRGYNRIWWITHLTVQDFLTMQIPKDDIKEIEKYWYTAINKLRSILALEYSPEQIFINYLIQSLPTNFKYEFSEEFHDKFEWKKMDKKEDKLVEKAHCLLIRHIQLREKTSLKSSITQSQSNPDTSQLSIRAGQFFPDSILTEFNGDLLSYRFFKYAFNLRARFCGKGLSDHQLLAYLKKCIKDDALIYIGSLGPHHDSCDKMWTYLDKKYNNKWLETTLGLKDFFSIQRPTEDLEDIKSYWCNAINKVQGILSLNFNLEQIFINYIIQLLPDAFQLELLKRMKLEQVYGIEEASDAFNGTITLTKIVKGSLGSSTDINRRGS